MEQNEQYVLLTYYIYLQIFFYIKILFFAIFKFQKLHSTISLYTGVKPLKIQIQLL